MKRELAEILDLRLSRTLPAEALQGLAGIFQLCAESFRAGGKLLLCGNGGSAADCEHLSGELMKSFRRRRPLPAELRERLSETGGPRGVALAEKLEAGLPAIPLVSNAALLTAILNDQGGDFVFAQQVLALGRPGDVLLGFSTSGNSANVVNALVTARALGLGTAGFSGDPGGEMKALCDAILLAPAEITAEIQAIHLDCYHALAEMLEAEFY